LKNLFLLAIIALCMVGCSTFENQSFFENSKVKVDMEAGNFKVTRLGIQGTAELGMLFGMGRTGIALGSTDMLRKCMEQLHAQYPMIGKSAFLHNITVERVKIGLPGIYLKHSLTITADVVEFTEPYIDYKDRP